MILYQYLISIKRPNSSFLGMANFIFTINEPRAFISQYDEKIGEW